jgi:hypothetical protein
MLSTSLCPTAEERIYKKIVENIANLDVDIKIRMRKGTHLVKTFRQQEIDTRVALNNIY